MEKYIGSWVLDKNENFDEYLQARDVPWLVRKALKVSKITKTFTRISDDTFVITNKSTMKTLVWKFRLDVPFETESYDKSMHEIKFELREDGLYEIHDRKKDGIVETYRYYFEGDYLILTTEHKNIVMKRYFKRSS